MGILPIRLKGMGVVPIPSNSGDEPPSALPPSVIVLIVEMSPFATNQIWRAPFVCVCTLGMVTCT
ncbi:hypothetical protein Hanom_Chr02g00151621 [Helianthus anomalus]